MRKGSLAGPIVLTARFGLTGGPEPGTYSRTPPRDALLIEGINHLIPGFLNDLEFWPDRMDVTVRGPLYPETGDYILGSLRLVFRPAKTLTVVIDGCDSEVPNILLSSGSTISELVAACAEGANNHGKFVICVDVLIKDLKKDGDITGHEKDAIHKCAADLKFATDYTDFFQAVSCNSFILSFPPFHPCRRYRLRNLRLANRVRRQS